MRAPLLLVLFLCAGISAIASKSMRIQSEKVHIAVYGLKPQFVTFNWTVDVVYEILDPSNLSLLENYAVPQPIDPTFRSTGPDHWNDLFFIDDVKINDFKMEKQGSGQSTWTRLKTKTNVTRPDFLDLMTKEYVRPIMTAYKLETSGLKKGDLIRVTYEWEAPFLSNPYELWSVRMFHHGEMDKADYELTISYPNDIQWNMEYMNRAEPDEIRPTLNKRMEEKWHLKNLPGCIAEPNSRAYLELPYIQVSFSRIDVGSIIGSQVFGFSGTLDVPAMYIFTTTRTQEHFDDIGGMSAGISSKNRRRINSLLEMAASGQTVPLDKMKKLHGFIQRKYEYSKSIKYYQSPSLSSLGVDNLIATYTMEDALRHRLYLALFYWTKTTVFLGFSMDKRSGIVSENYSKAFAKNDYFFASSDTEGNIFLFSPKANKSGMYINELPFYLQGTQAMLMYNLPSQNFTLSNSEITVGKTIKINIPANTESENIRLWNARITADASTKTATTKGRLSLSGQYSTLTRGIYMSNSVIDDAPDFYNAPVWDRSIGSFEAEVTEVSTSGKRPYSSIYNCNYSSASMTDEALPIGQWLCHFLPEPLDTAERSLTYYADFLGTDILNLQVVVNGVASELELPESILVENDFGIYQFNVVQGAAPNMVNIMSQLTIQKEEVTAENIDKVKALYEAARKAQEASIRWKAE